MHYTLERDVNNLVNFLTGTLDRAATQAQGGNYFPVNVVEKQDSIELVAFVPGVKKEDISVKFEEQGILSVSFKRGSIPLSEGERLVRAEIGEFQGYRKFDFKNTIDEKGVKAQSTDGVLTIHLPKKKADPEIKIEVL